MPLIVVHKDLAQIHKGELNYVDSGTILVNWLADNVDASSVGATVWLNGQEIADSDKHDNFQERLQIKLYTDDDRVDVFLRPRGVDPFSLLLYAGIALVSAVVVSALIPKPEIPGDAGKRSESPNNQLQAATNQFRVRQAIPDISGRVRSYPDFIQSSYYEYVNNLKIVKEIFCIGVGRYDVDDVKTGETLIDSITGSSYIIHPPGSLPSQLLDVRSSNEIDGQVLIASDDPSVSYSGTALISATGEITAHSVVENLSLSVGMVLDITFNGQDGEGTPYNLVWNDVTVTSVNPPDKFTTTENVSVDLSGDITITVSEATELIKTVLQGDAIEEIWFNIVAPRGIRSENGDALSINVIIAAYEVDANGVRTGVNNYTENVSISANSLDAQYRTFKLTGLVPSRYEVLAARVTPSQPEGAIDEIKWESVFSVTSYSGANFGDVTLLEVERRATLQPLASGQSKINCMAQRKLITPTSGGAYVATRSFADYVWYMLTELSGVPADEISSDLFSIYNSLSDPQLGYFDFTFDDKDVGLRERVEAACNVARVRYYNGIEPAWNFIRDEEQSVVSAMFNRRNIVPAASSQTFKFRRTADHDSVVVRYVDPDSNTEAEVSRKWSAGVISAGVGLRPLEIDLAGCRNVVQATNRANREIGRLVYERRQVQDTFMSDALFIGLGEVIMWADPNDSEIFSGEILGVNGNDYDTSERFVPVSGVTYYVYVTDNEGNVSNQVPVTARSDTQFGFTAVGLTGVYLAAGEIQLGSRYFIAADGKLTKFRITSVGRPDERNNVPVEMTIYAPEAYNVTV